MATRKTPKEVPSDHPLARLIPDPTFGQEYISRTINGIQDMDLLRYCQEAGKNLLLFGDTGPGKTAMVMAFCSLNRIPLVTVACNGGIDPNSFFGGIVPDPATQGIRWQDSDVTEVIRHGDGVLYLDEPNFMPPKTSAVFHPLLDKRRFITIMEKGNELVQAGPNLLIVGSYNPDYAGTRPLNQAFKNRFKVELHIDYDPLVEQQLICMPVVLELAEKLRAARKAGDIDTPTSTNMLIEFEEFAVDLDLDFAIDNFLAAFEAEEREAVRSVIEMHKSDLTYQLEAMIAG